MIVFGNCVASNLFNIVKEISEISDNYEVVYASSFIHPQNGKIEISDQIIEQASILLLQQGHLQFPEFYDKLPDQCKVIKFPLLLFPALWPFDMRDPRNKLEPENGCPFGRYPNGNKIVISLLRRGMDKNEIIEKFFSIDILNKINMKKTFEKTYEHGNELDIKSDVKTYKYIFENFKKQRLFWKPNHPTEELLIFQADQILNVLNLKVPPTIKKKILERRPLSRLHLPIHPQIIDYFELEWIEKDSKYRHFDLGEFTYEEYYKKYIKFDHPQM